MVDPGISGWGIFVLFSPSGPEPHPSSQNTENISLISRKTFHTHLWHIYSLLLLFLVHLSKECSKIHFFFPSFSSVIHYKDSRHNNEKDYTIYIKFKKQKTKQPQILCCFMSMKSEAHILKDLRDHFISEHLSVF